MGNGGPEGARLAYPGMGVAHRDGGALPTNPPVAMPSPFTPEFWSIMYPQIGQRTFNISGNNGERFGTLRVPFHRDFGIVTEQQRQQTNDLQDLLVESGVRVLDTTTLIYRRPISYSKHPNGKLRTGPGLLASETTIFAIPSVGAYEQYAFGDRGLASVRDSVSLKLEDELSQRSSDIHIATQKIGKYSNQSPVIVVDTREITDGGRKITANRNRIVFFSSEREAAKALVFQQARDQYFYNCQLPLHEQPEFQAAKAEVANVMQSFIDRVSPTKRAERRYGELKPAQEEVVGNIDSSFRFVRPRRLRPDGTKGGIFGLYEVHHMGQDTYFVRDGKAFKQGGNGEIIPLKGTFEVRNIGKGKDASRQLVQVLQQSTRVRHFDTSEGVESFRSNPRNMRRIVDVQKTSTNVLPSGQKHTGYDVYTRA